MAKQENVANPSVKVKMNATAIGNAELYAATTDTVKLQKINAKKNRRH